MGQTVQSTALLPLPPRLPHVPSPFGPVQRPVCLSLSQVPTASIQACRHSATTACRQTLWRQHSIEAHSYGAEDILIYSKTMNEHLEHLRLVFTQLRQHQLHMKKSKCSFAQTTLEYLGHIISYRGVAVDPAKVELCRIGLYHIMSRS